MMADVLSHSVKDTTREFLRSFSAVDCDSESESEFDELSPIPETPGDYVDGEPPTHGHSLDLGEKIIPFKTIFEPAGSYQSSTKNFWIPGQLIEVHITEYERQELKVLNPNLYKIVVTHGEHEWLIRRRYKHFRQLHDALALFRAKYHLPFPRTGGQREKRKTLKKEWRNQESVRLPLRPEPLIGEERIPARMKQLENYLNNLLLCRSYRNHPETLKFFEVSHLSFVARLGPKLKEGLIHKCSGGRRISIGCCGCLQRVHFAGTWNKRWFVLKDTCMAYIRPEDGIISDVLLMDSDFRVECGMGATGAKHGVLISNLNRNLLIKGWTSRNAREWADCIKHTADTLAVDFTKPNRFRAFAPARDNTYARWFVDARSYFEAVAEALEKAKEEIYITDWWLSPEIYLKRPIVDGDRWRLDVILQRKAEQGVKIFILLYKEIEAALMIKSIYSKQILMQKHENIKVLRHPDHIPGKGILLWAHHEKVVVIDQQIAFIGGIDLCYGRWDDAQHRLTDLGSIVFNAPPSPPPPSDISRPEESNITDLTELSDEWRSTDHQASMHNVNTSQTPPASSKLAADSDQIAISVTSQSSPVHAVPSAASKQHVFVNVVLTSEDQTSDTDGDNSNKQNEVRTHSDSVAVKKQSQQNCDKEHIDLSETKSPSEDSNSSTTSSGKRHLWRDKDKLSSLKLCIPRKQGSSPRASKTGMQTTYGTLDDVDSIEVMKQTDTLQVGNGIRIRSSSNTSDTSGSELLTKDNHKGLNEEPQSAVSDHSTGSGRISADIKDRMIRAFTRHKHEENNNQDRSGVEADRSQEDASDLARRRWKMIFNVQKFDSIARHPQTPELIPEELLTPAPAAGIKEKKRSHSFRDIVGNKFKIERKGSFEVRPDSGIFQLDPFQPVYRTHSEQDILERGLQGSTKLWIGKDYVNFIYKDFVNLHQPFEDFIDRKECHRMPWHDIGAVVYGKTARDVARHFISRWNFTKLAKYKRNTTFPLLLPKTYSKMNVPPAIKEITYEVKAQVLRSLCGWSAGIETVEMSIHEAYEFCIENSKHFIYIENQFFITQVGDQSVVSNGIGTALCKRILRAHRSGDDFKVYVVMPLLPAFEGEFGTGTGTALQAVTHWNFASICRGGNSLLEKLALEVPDPSKYIVFCGLRTWDKLNGKLVSELIYVHSKLMIVDDNTVIIGSANINDRSMLGKRDSELAIMFQDTVRNKIHLNGRILEPGPFGSSLRHSIFREHLGLTEKDQVDLRDPTSDSFYKNIWISQAAINTSVFDKVFRCIPSNNVYSFAQLKQYTSEPAMAITNPKEATTQLEKVKGYTVLIPLMFLKDENLTPKVGQKEALLPAYLWT